MVCVDELGLLGSRQGLELLRLRQKHGFSIVALGDDKQCQAVEAGAIIDLCRRALGPERVPEIITTIRQQTCQFQVNGRLDAGQNQAVSLVRFQVNVRRFS